MKQFPRLHPIGWLFIGSLALAMCKTQPQASSDVHQPANGIEFSTTELTEMLIEIDALGDKKLETEYISALETIDAQCLERTQKVVSTAMRMVKEDDMMGHQYAVLNYLEVVEFATASYSQPIECLNFLELYD